MIVEATPATAGEALDESAAGSRIAQQNGLTVWFTGLSGAGKTTICRAVATELLAHGLQVEVIDGDVIRNYLCKDLGFSKRDRDENIRRIAFVAQLLTRNGTIVLVSAISPYREGGMQHGGPSATLWKSTSVLRCLFAKYVTQKTCIQRRGQARSKGLPASMTHTNRRWRQRSYAIPNVRVPGKALRR